MADTVKLKLKTLIRTDEAYLVDLGQGKVWIPKEAIKSTRRIEQGIFEIEILKDVVREKREEMRRLKEQVTGLKGSVIGEVVEFTGAEIIKEVKDALLVKLGDMDVYIPRVCFAEQERLPDGKWRFVIQKDYLEFKIRQLQNPDSDDAYTKVEVKMIQETDRAYLLAYREFRVWYPKRQLIEAKHIGDKWEIVVPTDFWRFKLEESVA